MTSRQRPVHVARQRHFASDPSAFAQAIQRELGYDPASTLALVRLGSKVRNGRYIDESDVAALQKIYPAVPVSAIVERVREVNSAEPGQRFDLLIHHLSGGGKESSDFSHQLISDFEKHEASIAVERRLDTRAREADERHGRTELASAPSQPQPGDGSVRGTLLAAAFAGQQVHESQLRNQLATTVEQASARLHEDAKSGTDHENARDLRSSISDAYDMENAAEVGKDLGLLDERASLHEWGAE